MSDVASVPLSGSAATRFTSANAREMAKRSHEARLARLEALRIAADPIPLPPDNSYHARRLTRVRGQIDIIDSMLEAETDAQKLDRLASALARLSEIERQLAGRPLPGSLRPSSPRKQSYTQLPPPTED